VLAAIFGNVGTLISFRVGDTDADELAGAFAPWPANVLRELGRGETLMRVLRGGEPMEPILVYTRPFNGSRHGRGQNVITQSNMRFTRKREQIEDKIGRWLKST
jgi:hypothetical protein